MKCDTQCKKFAEWRWAQACSRSWMGTMEYLSESHVIGAMKPNEGLVR
jgi:hypothetical protein